MSGGFSKVRLERMRNVMAGFVDRGEMPGLVTLISRRGEVHVNTVGTQAVGGGEAMRRDTIFRIASITKLMTAAAAMILVEECRVRLDEPIDALIPELANRRVLRSIDAELDDTVPAKRSITLRDLLTFRMGFGSVMAAPGSYPIQKVISEAAIGGDGPPKPALAPDTDEWLRRLGALPLMCQPGEKWMYHTGSDVLGVLIERASGQRLETFMRKRVFDPLGMKDTGFHVPGEGVHRLPPSYVANHESGKLELYDGAGAESQWSVPPKFQAGGGGLVSTVDDCHAFFQMMLDKGRYGGGRILSRPAVELMTSDQLTPEQRAEARLFFGDNSSWGFGMSVGIWRDDLWAVPGRFGWTGGLGTSAFADPQEGLFGVLMTQRMMDSPVPPRVMSDFWTLAYQTIED